MPSTDTDVIDTLVGIAPGSPLEAIRARRPEARTHAQASYRALFAPEVPADVTTQERFAVGSFVTGLHGGAAIAGGQRQPCSNCKTGLGRCVAMGGSRADQSVSSRLGSLDVSRLSDFSNQ